MLAGSAAWACVLLGRTPSWNLWLTPLIATTCALAIAGLLGAPLLGALRSRAALAAVVLGVVSAGIGGFSGEGGRLSLAAFEQCVKRGEIYYYVASQGAGGGPGGGSSTSAIANWVKANFKAVTIGGTSAYDLTSST